MGLRCATRTLPAPLSTTPSPTLLVYLRECVAAGSASARTACPISPVPHSASLSPATATRVLSTSVSISAPSTGLDECLFFISLVSDPLAVRFSVSSGCARRCSVSTYATILVLLSNVKYTHIALQPISSTFSSPFNRNSPFFPQPWLPPSMIHFWEFDDLLTNTLSDSLHHPTHPPSCVIPYKPFPF